MAQLRDDSDPVPESLARLVASEWPGASFAEQSGNWGRACQQWLADHPGRVLPVGESGDIAEHIVAARQRHYRGQRVHRSRYSTRPGGVEH